MAKMTLVIGRSGMGKTASRRNIGEDTAVINVTNKPLPFKNNPHLKVWSSDKYLEIRDALRRAYDKGIRMAVIDDAGYIMTNKFMDGHRQAKGNSQFDLYNEIADTFYNLIKFAADELPNDMLIFVFMHEDINDMGYSKPKTIGKLLDDKVCIEGMFTIVLKALKKDKEYLFATNTDGLDVTKSPIGMFEDEYISNDLQLVADKIREYYK